MRKVVLCEDTKFSGTFGTHRSANYLYGAVRYKSADGARLNSIRLMMYLNDCEALSIHCAISGSLIVIVCDNIGEVSNHFVGNFSAYLSATPSTFGMRSNGF